MMMAAERLGWARNLRHSSLADGPRTTTAQAATLIARRRCPCCCVSGTPSTEDGQTFLGHKCVLGRGRRFTLGVVAMVNRGRSNGCHTCKRRRVKCDETTPICKTCARVNVKCEGYALRKSDKVIFKYHSLTIAGTPRLDRKKQPRLTVRDLCQHHVVGGLHGLPPNEENLAFGFFLHCFVAPGQKFNSARGFLGTIIPALYQASAESPVYLAFSAVATQMYSQWRHGIIKPSGLPKVRLIQAQERLQAALQDPVESTTQSTLVATLLLQFQDNVTSVQCLHMVSRTHQNGALALARHRGMAGFDTPDSKHILYRLINVEVSSAIREGRPMPEDLRAWCSSNDVPQSPSSDLDKIGIHVADIQRKFAQIWRRHSRCTTISCPHLGLVSEVCEQATAAEKELIAWAAGVPTHWTPFKFNLERLQGTNPPIQTYQGACDVYPSIQIASIWNSWRCYRLVALTTLLTCIETFDLAHLAGSISSSSSAHNVDRSSIRTAIQHILDSICASIPFHVGNRVRRCSLEDFSDKALAFPAYHCFLRDELGRPERMKLTLVMPRDEHNRHVIAQGPAGASLASALREEQLSWVQGQLRRCVTILGLDQDRLDPDLPSTARNGMLLSDNLSVTLGR